MKFVSAIIGIMLSVLLFAQQPGNEWINYSQKYFKFPVSSDGVYRIDRTALVNAEFPIDEISPENLQLFNRGREVPIYVSMGQFGILNYLEFYGKKNTGWLDSVLYDNFNHHLNKNYSMINDTNFYFITSNSSTNNLRYVSETDVNFAGYIPSPYCIKTVRYDYTSAFYSPEESPFFSAAEGWFHPAIDLTSPTLSKTIATPFAYSSGSDASVSFGFAAISNALINETIQGNYNHHVRVQFLNIDFDTSFIGRTMISKAYSDIPSVSLAPDNVFTFSIIDNPGIASDMNALSYVQVVYPHTYDFENAFSFTIPAGNNSKTYLQISNFNAGSSSPVLYDLTNNKRITVSLESGFYHALIPDDTMERNCILVAEAESVSSSVIKPVSASHYFTNYLEGNKNSDYIIVTHPSLLSVGEQYKIHRNTTGFNAMLANIEELYDQFAYGIPKHPLGIRNFIRAAIQQWDSVPQYLLLAGKSIHAKTYRQNTAAYDMCLVPSMGNLSSDALLTAKITTSNYIPALATGRISAQTPAQLSSYLKKVQEYELNQTHDCTPVEWMKNVLHFGGGYNVSEQNAFMTYLNSYKNIIEDTLFGGSVSSFFKTSSMPIQITQSDTIRNLINTGVSLLTFFGHASANGFDLSIDEPEFYNNKGKYPFLLANSCFAGDIHQTTSTSMSERWVLIEDKGVIAYLASVGPGYTSSLHGFSTHFYNQIGRYNYGKPVGISIQQTMQNFMGTSSDSYVIITCLDFTLHGDPAIKINYQPKPDLLVHPAGITFFPEPINTETDSFEVRIVITNAGMATNQLYRVDVTRIFPDGLATETINRFVYANHYHDTIVVKFPIDLINGLGLNKFKVVVDANGSVVEICEDNNITFRDILIYSSDIVPVWPYKYAIYPNNNVILKASTGYPFIGNDNYIFEIDTCDAFNSPLFQYTSVVQSGGVISWQVPFSLTDSTVYYWKVARASSSNWKESSFIYIPGKTGWSQAHHFQFKNDFYNWIEYDKFNRRFNYIATPLDLTCHNKGGADSDFEFLSIQWRINGNLGNGMGGASSCGMSHAILVSVIDSFTVRSWYSDRQNFGQFNYQLCPERSSPDEYFCFYSNDAASLNNMANMLQSVPNGNYILVYSFIHGHMSNWTENAFTTIESLNGTNIRSVPDNYPFIFFCQKGNPSSAKLKVGTNPTDTITLFADLSKSFPYGDITSELIGPSAQWNELHWKSFFENPTLQDSVSLKLIGVSHTGNTTDLLTLSPDITDINNLSEYTGTGIYPYLKFKIFSKNDSLRVPAQLKKWQIMHGGVPETAVNPQKGYYFFKDTVNQGENISFSVAYENISQYNMDSLLLNYWVMDKNNNRHYNVMKRLRPHPAGDVIRDTVSFSTLQLPGLNSLWVEANPVNPATGNYDQLEQYHFNNIAQRFFYVESDKYNPLLDVTFDGIHILDGDIVSAKPEIVVQLKDENKYFALDDTSLFAVFLTSVETGSEKRVYFTENGEENMKWIPAQLPNNSFRIHYNPVFPKDGKYQLRVQAKDKSNNESGDNDYFVNFEVVNKSTITEIFNYPNPFSTATKFVFELTGSEIPTDFRIQILTVTGKLVKTISLAELGNIHIGRNITDYAWDGTDDFGDKLANGVYFYHVITSINGQSIEKRTTAGDKYFKHGFGKLYIMR